VLVAAGIGAGMNVLDVGCGVGDVSFLAGELVGPEGSVVGVDLDAGALAFAERRRASLGVGNVSFQLGDARSVGVGGVFDAAVGRLVLKFMSDPIEAIRRIADRVRPGGVLAFQETLARPTTTASGADQPVLARVQGLINDAFAATGASNEIAAGLASWMRAAGLVPDPRPLAELAYDLDFDPYDRWAPIARSLLPKMVEYGLVSEDEGTRLIERDLRDELRRGDFVPVSPLMVGVWARKQAR